MVIRDLANGEAAFLEEMLYTALAWRPGVELPPKEWVLEHAQVIVFHRDWGRAGDTALVAEEDGRPVGAAWYRFFTEAEHGEGYVDDETPELAIAVVDDFRGRGIGRRLMDEIHARARADGLTRIPSASTPRTPRNGSTRHSGMSTSSWATATGG